MEKQQNYLNYIPVILTICGILISFGIYKGSLDTKVEALTNRVQKLEDAFATVNSLKTDISWIKKALGDKENNN